MSSIKDVARLAGVSISTVSRVLNDSCPVNEDKRIRVQKVARELGYFPNPAARSLLLRKTGMLGVVVPFATGEFFSDFLSGVDQTASDNDYFLLISISHRSDADLKLAVTNLHRRVDGLIVWAPEMPASEVTSLVGKSTRIVFVNSLHPAKGNDLIDFDNHGGMHAVATHLLGLGHRDIVFIKGPPRAADSSARLSGYRSALADHGLAARPEFELAGDYTVEAGYDLVPEILRMSPLPTAIMAPNDQSAVGVLRGLNQAGVSVPEQMSVTGFDDVPSSRFITPSLTTAHVPVREMGELAIQTIVDRIGGREHDAEELLAVDVVVRRSSAPPRLSTVAL